MLIMPAIFGSVVPVPQRMTTMPAPGELDVRSATAADAPFIHALIVRYEHEGHLLPRSLGDVATHATRFVVAVKDGILLGCAELAPLSRTVAEVRSLVVDEQARGLGVGRQLIDQLRKRARAGRFRTLCAFTHDPRFFVRLDFSMVPHFWLPEKVSADCWSCVHFQKCSQYAMVDTTLGRFPAPVSPSELH
jgi:amino-acid N-acetyltransferase